MGYISEKKLKEQYSKSIRELNERLERLETFIKQIKEPKPEEKTENKVKEEVNNAVDKTKEIINQ
jgi:phosphopantetheine adenylyltransferase